MVSPHNTLMNPAQFEQDSIQYQTGRERRAYWDAQRRAQETPPVPSAEVQAIGHRVNRNAADFEPSVQRQFSRIPESTQGYDANDFMDDAHARGDRAEYSGHPNDARSAAHAYDRLAETTGVKANYRAALNRADHYRYAANRATN